MKACTILSLLLALLVETGVVAATSIISPSNFVRPRGIPIPPSQDPFYQPPAGFENASPGTALGSRPVPNPLAAFNIAKLNLAAAYQILYRTSDSHGNPEASVTTLMIPYNSDPTKLLSYQVAEDSAFLDCAPSYAFQQTATRNLSSQAEMLPMAAALNRGWYVNTLDYEGPKSASKPDKLPWMQSAPFCHLSKPAF
jgi:hypothetical protein